MKDTEIKELLEFKYEQFNSPEFITTDPVSIPHLFTKKEDIEIAAFLSATIAWGQRKSIINNATKLMEWMDMSPYDFIINSNQHDLTAFTKFVHRTFNGMDCVYFIKSLKSIYTNYGSLENVFLTGFDKDKTIKSSIIYTRNIFLELKHEQRIEKHFSNPGSNSACKRINLFLRWMVRKDKHGVDFGLWKDIPSSALLCPLDVHSGNVSRKLGLLKRTQNDWQATEELTANLRKFDKNDPVKYDFALFGLGVFEDF